MLAGVPTRPKKKCVDCGDIHLCKATYAGSKRDEAQKVAAAAKPATVKRAAAATVQTPPKRSGGFLASLLSGDDED